MFFPGETITHRFVVPFAANEIDKAIFSYKQKEAIMFEKIITEGFIREEDHITSIEFQLSQGEGLLFADDAPFTVQVNIYTKVGTRHTSHEMGSSSGVQYLREVVNPETLEIKVQPVNCKVENLYDTAKFAVKASGAMRYQWQYSVNDGEWKDCTNGTNETLEVIATQERIDTHTYHCVVTDVYENSQATDVVRILYTDRSDE